jgi:tetratricopeptide (TPR) repeat protein
VNEREIFHAVIELTDPAERLAYLEKVCAGNASMRQHVEGMLQVYPQLGTFLESPLIELDGEASPPARAGRYQLGKELARGGMGVVYSARDESLGRDVAVKVLRQRYQADALAVGRFVDEARITAQLQHPGIPPVFEVGRLDDERPYLAMKLIKGRTLEDLLTERSEPASDRSRFLAAFQQICQTLAYAHARGVIHRDLKPGNVMVGAFGEVQVMDWGLAKLLQPDGAPAHAPAAATQTSGGTVIQTAREHDSGTLAGSILGTPAYMAPEQAAGEIDRLDERTDVFGLGAILCVILTGAPPYIAKSGEERRLMAIRGTLAQAHARLDQCGADAKLVELCRACLSAEHEARPRDAGVVAAAVAGYLAGVEERARQAETERAKAVVREAEQRKRRRTVQVAGGAIAVVLLAGLGVSLWQMFRAIDAEGLANQNAQKAFDEGNAKDVALQAEQQARADETKAQHQAFAALRSMTADVIEKRFAQGMVLTEDDRAFLRGIIAQFDAFADIKGNDVASRALRAEGRLRVGNIRSTLGELKEAELDYDQALSTYQQLVADFPARPKFREALAVSHNNRGALLIATGRLTEAEQDYDKALTIYKQLAAEFPARPELRQKLSDSHNNRGNLLHAAGRLQEAEEDYDYALSSRQQLAAEFPSRTEFRQLLANTHMNRGVQLRATGRLDRAEEDYDQALSIHRQLATEFPSRPEFRHDLAKSHYNRGELLRATGRLEEAEEDFDQALSIQKQLAADFPARPEFRHDLAASHDGRGAVMSITGRLEEAQKDYEQALSIQKQLAADFPARPEFRQNLAHSHQLRGGLLCAKGRLQEAQQDYEQALSIGKQLAADFPDRALFRQELARSHLDRGSLLHTMRRLKEAEEDYEQALSIQKQLTAEFPSRPELRQDLATSHNNRGNLLYTTRRLKEAEHDYGQALSIQKQLAADFPSHPDFRQELAGTHNNRGELLRNTSRFTEAEHDYDEALSIQKQLAADFPSHSEFRRDLAVSHNNRGILLRATGRPAAAEKDYDEALSIFKQLAADFPSRLEFRQKLAMSHVNRGNLLSARGRPKDAEQDYGQAISIRKQLAADFPDRPEFRRELAGSHASRGLLLHTTGRQTEAEKDYNQALSIQKQLAADLPDQPDLRNELAGTCVNLALVYQRQENWAAAKRLLLEGRPHHLAALKADPRHPTYRQFYRNHLNVLCRVHAVLLEQDDAVRAAETRRDLGWNAPADAYDAVCFLSLWIPMVAKHPKLDEKQRNEAAHFYGGAAMRLLRDAVSKGYADVVHMKKDTNLHPLRHREDFQKLVAELEGKGK